MSIKRFLAKTTSEALRKVRDALGSDAIILSNRPIGGNIEIVASNQNDISSLIPGRINQEREQEAAPAAGSSFFSSEAFGALLNRQTKAYPHQSDPQASATSYFDLKDLLKDHKRTGSPEHDLPMSDARASGNVRDDKKFGNEPGELTAPEPTRRTEGPAIAQRSVAKAKAVKLPAYQPPLETAPEASSKASTVRDDKKFGNEPGELITPEPTRRTEGPAIAKRSVAKAKAVKLPAHQSPIETAPEASSADKRRRGAGRTAITTGADASSVKKDQVIRKRPKQASTPDIRRLVDEIDSMRSAFEQQFALLNWNGQKGSASLRINLLPRLLGAGFSVSLGHGLLDGLMKYPDAGCNEKQAMQRIRDALTQNLNTIESEDEILEKGGIYALVGPTGVGKTTTTAKLAARCVIRHGAENLALVTTDGYRIGGHDQLRIYGKILGVAVHAVNDAKDLPVVLAELRRKHMVLIDTVGMSQRDPMVAEQVAMFAGCGAEVKRLLLLNAASSLQTLDEVAAAYRGSGLAGAIITKMDEAVVRGSALEIAIRHSLPLFYVSSGQRVPEDLELADLEKLVNLALDNSPAPRPLSRESLPPLVTHGKCAGGYRAMHGAALD
jgi:flagellar biosynthesis protein FlhF